jgi:5-methylcytosine-specific restriction enzyme subunit McrC
MPGTIKNRLQHKQLLNCEYDELSENNLLNQILKSTVFLLLKCDKVESKYKDVLKKEMLFFANVDMLELKNVKWSDIRFRRNNQTYRVLINICRLIVEGMLITNDKGDYKLASFIDEQKMYHLYERFILEYYRERFPELSVNASKIPWALDDGSESKNLPEMQSDITLQKGNNVLIIDAKYYNHSMQAQFGKRTIYSNNLYQIFTYVKNMDYSFGGNEHTVSGMLLYAKTDEEIQPGKDKPYIIHGSKIYVRTLDLYQDFSAISEQLDKIVKDYFEL